jgi:hypothetical protein
MYPHSIQAQFKREIRKATHAPDGACRHAYEPMRIHMDMHTKSKQTTLAFATDRTRTGGQESNGGG